MDIRARCQALSSPSSRTTVLIGRTRFDATSPVNRAKKYHLRRKSIWLVRIIKMQCADWCKGNYRKFRGCREIYAMAMLLRMWYVISARYGAWTWMFEWFCQAEMISTPVGFIIAIFDQFSLLLTQRKQINYSFLLSRWYQKWSLRIENKYGRSVNRAVVEM